MRNGMRGRVCDIEPIEFDNIVLTQTNIGLVLSSLRQNAGLKEVEAGQKIGVTSTTIHHWEHSMHTPCLSFFVSILDFYGYKLEVKKK